MKGGAGIGETGWGSKPTYGLDPSESKSESILILDSRLRKSIPKSVPKLHLILSQNQNQYRYLVPYLELNGRSGDTSFFDTDSDTETFPMSSRFRY